MGGTGMPPTVDYISKLELRACYFLVSVYSLDTGIPAVYIVLFTYSQVWAGRLEEFLQRRRKSGKKRSFLWSWTSRNGVCKRQVTLYLQFYGSSSCPQVSPKVVRNGEKSRIEALLVARFDAEDLVDERSTSVAQYKTARNKCRINHDFLQ